MKKTAFILLLSFFTLSCNAQKDCSNCGTAIHASYMLTPETRKFIVPNNMRNNKLWYKDSFIISDNYTIYFESYNGGPEKWKTVVDRYTFIDTRTKEFYVYSSFSDTARFIKKYSQPDTGRVEEGWTYFQKNKLLSYDNKYVLPDTLINGNTYKRLMVFGYIQEDSTSPKVKVTQIIYARCNAPNPFLRVDMLLSQELGCPVVRFDHIAENVLWTKTEIEYISDKLTPEELKVFDAWERNIKLYK